MEIFISGVGDATFGKMRVNIPNYIAKDEHVTFRSFSIPYSINSSNNVYIYQFQKENLISKFEGPQFNANIPNIYFNLYNISIFGNFGEGTVEGVVPYTIDFTISPNAPGGDHNIYLTLFYKLGDKWYTNSQVVPLHINRWYEKDWMQWAIIAAIASQIIPPIIKIYRSRRELWRKIQTGVLWSIRRAINFFSSFL
jgi:hypothetical protein